ncbi:autotransporter-associated beta strand repeat-containing protein [Roseimicrobium sp. ORNL1]|uniref:beta strand repeat-containing protein n=1 Tax=Roseimicrobium sp. ORNL1 TaxID=2711231 RepID=UPI0013E1B9FD|nr:autotransporter-associated beta strand repeat-containing protein [Roseimicrobium sp. ORNL1]QIF04877.1 hypothetical protein G5S37_26295 [Roseimicrobium sp. ORNL1]
MATLLALGGGLPAANDTWLGNISANWNDTNWTGGNNPPALSGDSLLFGVAGSAGAVLNNDFTSLSVTGITFNAGADAFVINGNAVSVVSITNSSSNQQIFNTGINLANADTFTSSAGGGNLVFNGVISNTVAHSLVVNGGGTVALNGDNTYGAGLTTTLNGATTLVLGHDHALGNSTLLLSSTGGAGTVTASATRTITNGIRLNNTGVTGIIGGSNAITFSGAVGVSSAASGTLTVNNTATTTFSGNVLGSAGQTYALTVNGTGNVNVSGTISNGTAGTVSLVYSGSGKMTLGGANTYSGNTTLSGGQLNLNNGGAGGTSSSLGTGTLVISGASTIDNTSGSAVTLSTNNAITLTNNTLTFGGSNDLSFGSGAVNWQSNNQTVILNGSASTLAFGGVMTNNQNSSNESFVVNGVGNTLSIGGFTSTNFASGKNLLLSGSGNVTFTGQISNGTAASVAVSYTGTGTLSLLGASTYTGNTTLGSTASVVVGNKAAFGIGGTILWNGASLSANTNLTGSNAIANNVTLGATTNTVTGSNSLELAGAVTTGASNRTLTNNIATGTFTLSNTVTVGSGTGSYVLTINGSGNTVISGDIVSGTTGTVGLTYNGTGSLTLSGENSYTGTTLLSGGSLVLDFSNVAAGTGVISGSSSLLLGTSRTATSQTLTLQGKDGMADVQSFAGLNFSASGAQGGGATHINLSTSGVGGSMTLNLGAFLATTRDISATVDITMPTGTFVTTTATVGADKLLQNNITVNGNDFATVDGAGNIVGLSTVAGGYASIASGATALTAAKANDIAAGNVSTNTVTVASLRFNDGSADSTLTINATRTLTVASTNFAGAILVTANVGNHLVKITGGTLSGINSRDLTLIQNNTSGLLQIDSVIADNGANLALTKSGLGTALLTAVNTYSNSTYINEGTLIAAGASNALGTGAGTGSPTNLISIARGAALQLGNNDAGGTLAATQTITNNGAVNFNRSDTALAFSNVISGAGNVSQIGTGTVALTGLNTYTGTTTVTSGNLQVGSSLVGQTGTGATLVNGSSAVLSGTGTVQGAATVILGSLRPGDNGGASIGTLKFASGLTFAPPTSVTIANLTLGSSSGVGDKIDITGGLSLNGNSNIAVTFGSGYTIQAGDTWTLLDWTGAFGANGFSTGTNLRTGGESALFEGNLDLPDLSALAGYAGHTWEISSLSDGGALTISIAGAVPEPSRAVLLWVGCTCLMWRRRRSGWVRAGVVVRGEE